jgi:tyrosine-protein kinase Etk/Wzc
LHPDQSVPMQPIVDISLSEVAARIFAQRRTVFLITSAATLLAVAVSFLLPKKYEASTIIMTPQQNLSAAGLLLGGGSAGALSSLTSGGFSLKNPNDMYAGLFRSQSVEDGVIKAENLLTVYKDTLQSDARKDLEKNTVIDSSAKDNLIHITVKDRSPQRAAAIANEYVEQYRLLSSRLALTEGGQRRRFFERQIADTKEQLVRAEDELLQQQRVSGVLEPNAQGRMLINTTAQLRAQVAAKEVALSGLETYATDLNPEVQRLRQEIIGLKAQLARILQGHSSEDNFLLTQAKAPTAALDYARKLRDVKYYQAVYEFLAKEAEVARLDEAHESTTVQVVDVATAPDKKSSPRRALITVLGFMLGLFGAIVYFALSAVSQQYREKVGRVSESLAPRQM